MADDYRQRWGTFSVRDHTAAVTDAPFVTDVLLFDRLIVPVRPPDGSATEFWSAYEPERQENCLDIMGVQEGDKDGLVIAVPWDAEKRERFKNRMSNAAALGTQARSPDADYYTDPFELTRELIKGEFLPEPPKGVSKVWAVAAYPSMKALQEDRPDVKLAAQIRSRFLTPADPDPNGELLRRAVGLATTDDFRRKRRLFYELQEEMLEEDIPPDKAVVELEARLSKYNKAVENAFADVKWRFLFTVIPIAAGLIGALYTHDPSPAPLIVGGVGQAVSLTQFYRFERKPRLDSGDLDGTAMIHDAQNELLLGRA